MRASEFIRRVQALGRKTGTPVRFDKHHGKGSHGTLYYGDRKTTVKDRKKEIGAGLLAAMVRQLGLDKTDLTG
jgi:mRNA interferase HicA